MPLLGREKVVRQRLEETRGADRRTEKTVVDETEVWASVQPITGRDREALPEGVRNNVKYRMYVKDEFRTADQLTNRPADRVIIDGETYRVLHVSRWKGRLANWEVDVGRLKEPDDPTWSPA